MCSPPPSCLVNAIAGTHPTGLCALYSHLSEECVLGPALDLHGQQVSGLVHFASSYLHAGHSYGSTYVQDGPYRKGCVSSYA